MPKFGTVSRTALASSHPDLQRLFNEVIKYRDCAIIKGHRTVAEQQAEYAKGRTKPGKIVTHIDGVKSKGMHNYVPALAVDAVPYPIDWNNTLRFYEFGGFVLGIAATLGIRVRWGGDWDGDGDFKDQKLIDLPHYELVDVKP